MAHVPNADTRALSSRHRAPPEARRRRLWSAGLSLRTVLVIYVILPLALVLIAVGTVALRGLEEQIERRLQEDVELVARAIQPALSRALEQNRLGSVEQALEAAFSIDRVYGAYVYDSEGATIATAGRDDTLPSQQRVSRLAREGDERGEYGQIAGRDVYSYFVPLTDSGARIIGVLQVTRRARDFAEYVARLRAQAVLAALLAFGLVTALVVFGHHGAIGSHLERIVESMQRIEAGEREHRSPVRGPDEIARLGGSLNTMLDSVQAAERQVEEHAAAERDLARRLQRSERLAAIGQLAAGVAHELGTPLSLISGRAQRMLRDDLDERVRRGLEETTREVRRMERIVQQLLDLGREHVRHVRTVRADRLVQSAVSTSSEQDPLRKASVAIEGPTPGPQVRVDPFRFEQALGNLLQNALQAAPEGRVRAAWSLGDGEVAFTVEDDGPGIADDARDRLFEPFFTTKSPGEGTGLGLSLVYRIVEEHGGRVEVAGSAMGGALFRIVLPADGSAGDRLADDAREGAIE